MRRRDPRSIRHVSASQVADTPAKKGREDRIQGFGVRRQSIPHAEARRLERPSRHEPVGFQLSQLFAQHFGGHAGHGTLKLAEPVRPACKPLEDHRLPASADHRNRRVQRTRLSFAIAVGSLVHGSLR